MLELKLCLSYTHYFEYDRKNDILACSTEPVETSALLFWCSLNLCLWVVFQVSEDTHLYDSVATPYVWIRHAFIVSVEIQGQHSYCQGIWSIVYGCDRISHGIHCQGGVWTVSSRLGRFPIGFVEEIETPKSLEPSHNVRSFQHLEWQNAAQRIFWSETRDR